VVVKDGKIAEIGEKVMVPAGAIIIEAGGQYLIPALSIATRTSPGRAESMKAACRSPRWSTSGTSSTPTISAIYRALAGGVTTGQHPARSANSIGGQTLPLKMRWGKSAQELIFAGATPGIKFALGENPKRSATHRAAAAQPPPRGALPRHRAWAWKT